MSSTLEIHAKKVSWKINLFSVFCQAQNYRERQEQKNLVEKLMEKLDEKEKLLHDWQKQVNHGGALIILKIKTLFCTNSI